MIGAGGISEVSIPPDGPTGYVLTKLSPSDYDYDWLAGGGGGGGITQLTGPVTAGPGSGSQATSITANAIINSMLAQVPALTIKGNNTGSPANVLDLTPAQVNAILPLFTALLAGLAPASGGGTSNFLRADATWAIPPDTGITQLTGDGTAGPGSGPQAITLATVNSNVGSFTSANITVDAKGRITAAANGSGGGGGLTLPQVQLIASLRP